MEPLTDEQIKWKIGRTQDGYGEQGLVLLDGDMDRVVSLRCEKGRIVICEECDGYFSAEMSKEEAKQALLEAIAWVDEQV